MGKVNKRAGVQTGTEAGAGGCVLPSELASCRGKYTEGMSDAICVLSMISTNTSGTLLVLYCWCSYDT